MKKISKYENNCKGRAYNKSEGKENCRKRGGYNMIRGVIHRCTRECPWNKKCFVCKTEKEVEEDVVVLHKCVITKEDIPIHLGKQERNDVK